MHDYRPIRGMRDLLPKQAKIYAYVLKEVVECLESYGFEPVQLPILESSDLFIKSIGLGTDIVEKEMYSFVDKGQKPLTLRPEGTAGCMRAGLASGALFHQVARWHYCGPMFRRERPQKGRYRQFYQIGAELLGLDSPYAELELIEITYKIFQRLGLQDRLSLKIHSIGDGAVRAQYSAVLKTFFLERGKIEPESRLGRQVIQNPWRLLDSKEPEIEAFLDEMPRLETYLDSQEKQHFQTICRGLEALHLDYRVDPRLVRGLDYYNRTVFEWFDPNETTQSTLCGGGRYDGLASQMGYRQGVPAVGFAIGLDRLVESLQQLPSQACLQQVCFVRGEQLTWLELFKLAERVRQSIPNAAVLHYYQETVERQLRTAKKQSVDWVLLPLDADGHQIKALDVRHSRWDCLTLQAWMQLYLRRQNGG